MQFRFGSVIVVLEIDFNKSDNLVSKVLGSSNRPKKIIISEPYSLSYGIMTQHHFDIEHAKEYGITEAILISNLRYWLEKFMVDGHNVHEGKVWIYNSIVDFEKIFPYLSGNQLRYSLDKLVETGVLIKGNFSKDTFNKKLWYTFAEPEKFLRNDIIEGVSDIPKSTCENSQVGVGNSPNLICNTNNKLTNNKLKTNKKKKLPKVTLAEWEEENGELDVSHLKSWGLKHGLDANLVWKAIQEFRDSVVAGGYLYVDYPAAFRKWNRDKLEDLKKQSIKPKRML